MTDYDDGHGPSYGCNYQQCGNPSAPVACPFVADEKTPVREAAVELARKLKADLDEHEHRYTIPVEWEYINWRYKGDGTAERAGGMAVTKLRCECGDEVQR